ncbi:hypothetical protein DIPPA_27234 [Diplonema papillatum]|nr:hypothetical protein DIPPA_27234 [Diplonema papillatum]
MSKQYKQLVVDGAGTTIVDDMVEYVDEDKVQFALVQIPIGSGAFQRNKMIMVKWVGERTPAMKKAKQVQKTGEVAELFGSTHASITLTKYDEVDLEHILNELKHVFVTDNGEFSIGNLKEEIMARIAANKKKQEEKVTEVAKTMAAIPKLRPSATDMGIDAEQALKEIRKPLGALNWALFEASTPLKLHEAGSDSVPEMQEHMDDSKVLYGVVRLGFGLGNFRRTKWVGVTFVGAKIGAVQRGKWLSVKSEMMTLLKPHQVTLEIQGAEMFTLEYVLDKVRPYIVADSIDSKKRTSEQKAAYSGGTTDMKSTLADFNKALLEEKAAAAEFFGEDPTATMASLAALAPEYEDLDVKDTIEKVKSANDPLLWAVFSLAHQ